jgi:hypothetical protein
MDDAQRKKLEAGKKRLEEFRKKKEAQEAAANQAVSSSAQDDAPQNSFAISEKHPESGLADSGHNFFKKKMTPLL